MCRVGRDAVRGYGAKQEGVAGHGATCTEDEAQVPHACHRVHGYRAVWVQMQVVAGGDERGGVGRPAVGEFVAEFVAEGEAVVVARAVGLRDDVACERGRT